jgi:hypothetical protein
MMGRPEAKGANSALLRLRLGVKWDHTELIIRRMHSNILA